MDRELYVYIDESGNTIVNDELYICIAILVPAEKQLDFLANVEKIALDKCNGVIKSSSIRNCNTRTELLQKLSPLDFQYVALIVNKKKLTDYPGLKFSGSFYKFFQRKLATYLEGNAKYDKLHFIMDEYGTVEFQKSFASYFNDKIDSLFADVTLDFHNDEEDYGIQVADLVAGTLGRCYFHNRDSANASIWLKMLNDKCAGHKLFPHEYCASKSLVLYSTDEEEKIASVLLKNAHDFLVDNIDSDDEFIARQCEVLNTLLVMQEYSDKSYIYSDELMARLESQGFESISKQVFTSQVIGKLRDAKVIITGNANGYKLALCKEDIINYVKHNDAIISPMINRLCLANDLLRGSFSKDFLDGFDNLSSFVNEFRHNEVLKGTEINEEALFEDIK